MMGTRLNGYEKYGRIKALKVKQWLESWEHVPNFNKKNRKKPGKYFFQFIMF